ncbi:MAG TPA: class I SAM-dependent methyltransferase, partial [Chitinophagaceae bacterium]
MPAQMSDAERKEYWDHIYNTKAADQVSWFQAHPATAIGFVESFNLALSAHIIDIGGGDSRFVDALLDRGYHNVWVLDISKKAIENARQRLGARSSQVHWIVCDATRFHPEIQFDYWHDRAAFHFLTNKEQINEYVNVASRAVKYPGYLTIGTFSESGPKKCSGLDIRQ